MADTIVYMHQTVAAVNHTDSTLMLKDFEFYEKKKISKINKKKFLALWASCLLDAHFNPFFGHDLHIICIVRLSHIVD